jgi:hypothetical protein
MRLIDRYLLVLCVQLLAQHAWSAESALNPAQIDVSIVKNVFARGEKLTYDISFSKIVKAGISTLEVRSGEPVNDKPTIEIVSETHSTGIVDTFYPVKDFVKSTVDAENFSSIAYSQKESHGPKKRDREMRFDATGNSVTVVTNGKSETHPISGLVQDALSSLYYVRIRKDLSPSRAIVVHTQDNDKTWSVEVTTLGKEHISTPAGEFDTIKIRTYPKYDGVFMNTGEIYVWLTDDANRVPVQMKSVLSIGSIVATLTSIQGGK